MQRLLEDALDDLTSPRSSHDTQRSALLSLEETLVRSLQRKNPPEVPLEELVRLQDSFNCNVVARSLPWLGYQITSLKDVNYGRKRNLSSSDDEAEFQMVSQNVLSALTLLQGFSLLHTRSKEFLGKRYSIEILLDVLSVSRQAILKPVSQNTSSVGESPAKTAEHEIESALASAVLDTLLCVLVDSPPSMREFEKANGLELVVKVLKRAAIPRLVRMKCLEFLYFYLMDEEGPEVEKPPKQVPTRPSSPTKPRVAPSEANTPLSRASSSASDGSSFSSFKSWSDTPPSVETPPQSPTKPNRSKNAALGPLGMLRKDVDFVPMSPKKAQIQQLGIGRTKGGPSPFLRPSRRERAVSPLARTMTSVSLEEEDINEVEPSSATRSNVRSMEEKKRTLGQLLGNVDALVEGVRKAGLWGLRE